MKVNILKADSNTLLTVLTLGEHVIGRGTLDCNDKRISRKHAIISVSEEKASLLSTHVNPCFFYGLDANCLIVLKKDYSTKIETGDKFALVEDGEWYKVQIDGQAENADLSADPYSTFSPASPTTSPIRTKRHLENGNGSIENGGEESKKARLSVPLDRSEPDNLDSNINDVKIEELETQRIFHNLSPDLEPQINTENQDTQRSFHSASTASPDNVELLDDLVKTNNNLDFDLGDTLNDVESSLNVPGVSEQSNAELNSNETKETVIKEENDVASLPNIEIKDEPIDVPVEQPEIKEEPPDVKPEIKDSAAPSNPNNLPGTSTQRDRCWYGASCYRKNPMHRSDFSHPGDSDYDPPSDGSLPDCQFGAACYRVNPEHRRQFKHPNDKPAKKPEKKPDGPKKKRDRAPKNTDDAEENDYDLEDPFIDDGSSDEYFPSQNVDESDEEWD